MKLKIIYFLLGLSFLFIKEINGQVGLVGGSFGFGPSTPNDTGDDVLVMTLTPANLSNFEDFEFTVNNLVAPGDSIGVDQFYFNIYFDNTPEDYSLVLTSPNGKTVNIGSLKDGTLNKDGYGTGLNCNSSIINNGFKSKDPLTFLGEDLNGIWKVQLSVTGQSGKTTKVTVDRLSIGIGHQFKPTVTNSSRVVTGTSTCSAKDGTFNFKIQGDVCRSHPGYFYSVDNGPNVYFVKNNASRQTQAEIKGLSAGNHIINFYYATNPTTPDLNYVDTVDVLIPSGTDNKVPIIVNCPPNTTVNLDSNGTRAFTIKHPTFTDDCGTPTGKLNVNFTDGATDGGDATHYPNLKIRPGIDVPYFIKGAGKEVFEFVVTDNNKNVAKCTTSVTAIANTNVCANDTVPPSFLFGHCRSDYTVFVPDNNTVNYFYVTDPFITDNCGITFDERKVTYTGGASKANGSKIHGPFPFKHQLGLWYIREVKGIGQMIFSWEIGDAKNNRSTCSFTVTTKLKEGPCVNDYKSPTITSDCKPNSTVSIDPVTNRAAFTFTTPAMADNCGIDSTRILIEYLDGATGLFGETTREFFNVPANKTSTNFYATGEGKVVGTFFSYDKQGNQNSCRTEISITSCSNDTEKPIAKAKDITVNLDASGKASIEGEDIDNSSTDNCNIAYRTASVSNFGCSKEDYSLIFDGNDDVVDCGNTFGNFGTGNFTIEAWFKTAEKDLTLVSKRPICNVSPFWTLSTRVDGKIFGEINGGNGGTFVLSTNTVNNNQWTHVAFVREGTKLLLYINGVLDQSQTHTSQNVDNTSSVLIGKSACTKFKGSLDEIRVWKVARTAIEIAAWKDSKLIGNENGLEAYYDFEDGPGSSTIKDRSVKNRTGTLSGFNNATAFVTPGKIPNGGTGQNTVVLTVTDLKGNSSTATAKVNVVDNMKPSITEACPQNQTIAGSDNTIQLSIKAPTFSDNCGITSSKLKITYSGGANDGSGGTSKTIDFVNGETKMWPVKGSGQVAFEYTATDNSGNTANCTSTVTLTSSGTICRMTIGDGCVFPGSKTLIPVTVQNFNKVYAFQFTLAKPTNNALSLTNIANMNPTVSNLLFNKLPNGEMIIVWDDPQAEVRTLADGTKLFDIEVSATAAFNSPGMITTLADVVIGSTEAGTTLSFQPATICVQTGVTPKGIINNPLNKAHAGVKVELQSSGSAISSANTGADGSFTLALSPLTNRVRPTKNDEVKKGITVIDAAKVRSHTLQKTLLTDPYSRLAADANRDGKVNVLDVSIINQIVLTKITAFPNNTSWRFLPKNLDISSNPEKVDWPEYIDLNQANLNFNAIDFVSVKVGDVDHTSLLQGPNFQNRSGSLSLRIPDTTLTPSTDMHIPIYLTGPDQILAMQMTINYDTNHVSFVGIDPHQIPGFGPQHYNNTGGKVVIAWDHPQGSDFKPLDSLMTLKFNNVANTGKSDLKMTDIAFYDVTFSEIGITPINGSINFMPVATENLHKTYSVTATPNPFTSEAIVEVKTNVSEAINISILDVNGKELQKLSLAKSNHHKIPIQQNYYQGILFISIKGETFAESIRLIKF